jgi:hypothetical protein
MAEEITEKLEGLAKEAQSHADSLKTHPGHEPYYLGKAVAYRTAVGVVYKTIAED